MSASPAPARRRSIWETAGIWLWVALALGVAARIAFASDPARNNVYLKVFAPAADAFAAGRDLYAPGAGFRYPPLTAALLVPFAACGPVLGSVLWRWAMLLVLALGVRAVFRTGFPQALSSRERGVFLVLLAVAAVVSFNNGQPNVAILGLLLWATAGSLQRLDCGPAAALTACTVLKVYPLAYGLVLAALRPRLLRWLVPGLALAVLLPFALRPSGYVLDQYAALYRVLAAEDRTMDPADAYRDLRLVAAAAGVPMSAALFHVLQVTGGLGIVLLCFGLRRAGAAPARVLDYAFSLTICWFLLLGPATEKATYALLGPPLAWPLLAAWRARGRAAIAAWGAANLLVILDHTVAPVDRAVQAQHPWCRCFLPWAALLASLALLLRAVTDLRRNRRGAAGEAAAVATQVDDG